MTSTIPASKALAILENASDLLPGGSTIETRGLNAALAIKRHKSGSWVLWIKRPGDVPPLHTRWADTQSQLLEDLEYFVASDTLPCNEKNRW